MVDEFPFDERTHNETGIIRGGIGPGLQFFPRLAVAAQTALPQQLQVMVVFIFREVAELGHVFFGRMRPPGGQQANHRPVLAQKRDAQVFPPRLFFLVLPEGIVEIAAGLLHAAARDNLRQLVVEGAGARPWAGGQNHCRPQLSILGKTVP